MLEGALALVVNLHVGVSGKRFELHGLQEGLKIATSVPPIDLCKRFRIIDEYHLRSYTNDRP